MVSRFERSVSDGKTASRKSNRKALVPFGELVMFMLRWRNPRTRMRSGTMLGLVDRSDEVVIGTTEEVVKSIRSVPLQPLRAGRWAWPWLVLSVFRWFRWSTDRAVSVMEPREHKARRFYVRRQVVLARYGFTVEREGCRVAQVGAEAKPHGEGCRVRIRQAMMNDDVGQQRLHAAVPATSEDQRRWVLRMTQCSHQLTCRRWASTRWQ